jgi:hypothetical protein
MSLRTASFGFASALLLLTGVPAFAGDSATVQDNQQTNTVTGNGNTTVNVSKQRATTIQKGRRTGDSGTSQVNTQANDVLGDGNRTVNVNKQESITRQNSRRVRH